MTFEIEHPTKPGVKARYGWSPYLGGFLVEVCVGQDVLHYSPVTTDSETTLRGALGVLVEHEFTTWDDIYAATKQLQLYLVEEIDDSEVRMAATIIENFKMGAS